MRPSTGGPVHPVLVENLPPGADIGIRLRQWYAGTALPAILGNPNASFDQALFNACGGDIVAYEVALAFRYADAMIAHELEGK